MKIVADQFAESLPAIGRQATIRHRGQQPEWHHRRTAPWGYVRRAIQQKACNGERPGQRQIGTVRFARQEAPHAVHPRDTAQSRARFIVGEPIPAIGCVDRFWPVGRCSHLASEGQS